MTREETKVLLPIIQAYAEGKAIESRCIKGDKSLWYDDEDPSFDGDFEFRIKPGPKYRPFKDAEECWEEMQKHQPFGWYKDKDGDFFMVSAVSNQGLRSLQVMFENGDTFVDGFPFGVKVEE